MLIRESQLRSIIAEELKKKYGESEKTKKARKKDGEEAERSVTPDDSDVLLDCDDDSKLTTDAIKAAVRKYFAAMGLTGKLPPHAKLK